MNIFDYVNWNYSEVRTKTIGLIGDELIIVVIHTDTEQKRRIISARRATKNERERYYHR
ncbi:MAG: BrnT family toxin [Calothrix sp. SM1_7_51]|nr:BrnT family toxin [Calothrix sp. SM1_7_51]